MPYAGGNLCHTASLQPGGVHSAAFQRPELRQRLDVEAASQRLARFLTASVELMKVMARACGHDRLDGFSREDLATVDPVMTQLAGVGYAGLKPRRD
jgi:glutamate synthase domain-containing protein 2